MRKYVSLILGLSLSAVLGLLACQHPPIVPQKIFSGQVISAENQRPIAGLGVSLSSNLFGQYIGPTADTATMSDLEGGFQLAFTDISLGGWHDLGVNSYPNYDKGYTSAYFHFTKNQSASVVAVLHPYTRLKVIAENIHPINAGREIYLSFGDDHCFCTELETDMAIGHGETRVAWFLRGDADVMYDTVYTYADSLNVYRIYY